MKAANLIKYSAGVLILSMLTALSSCGNKGGSDSTPVVQQNNVCGVNIACGGAVNPVGGSTLFQAESQDWYGVVKFTWTFLAQNPIVTQPTYNPYGTYNTMNPSTGSIYGAGSIYGNSYSAPPAMMTYSGPVAVNGAFSVLQGMNLGMCQLPVGSYSLGTLTSGIWSQTQVSHLRMQAAGPAAVIMTLSQGQVSGNTNLQSTGGLWTDANAVGRIFGNVVIESVNGYPCNMSVLVQ
ncbi:MAG: hypothetical protein H7256_09785 [Bdellovibrio sp.]|nr:hypothetical protein [Bdellovibrio sp.]